MNNAKTYRQILNTVFKAVALAMAVAVVVTSILGVMEPQSQILLIGIGLFAMAVTTIDKE